MITKVELLRQKIAELEQVADKALADARFCQDSGLMVAAQKPNRIFHNTMLEISKISKNIENIEGK